jgi:hypothetical protein
VVVCLAVVGARWISEAELPSQPQSQFQFQFQGWAGDSVAQPAAVPRGALKVEREAGRGAPQGLDSSIESMPPDGAASSPLMTDRSPQDGAAADASTNSAAERGISKPGAGTLVDLLPPALIEQARNTVWDQQATESLERLLLLAFDANGDFSLDDGERIAAVRALREVMWPSAEDDAHAFAREVMTRGRSAGTAESSGALLRPEDLRLHHDVDESRRRDHAAEGVGVGGELRVAVIERFQLVDDGRLMPTEFARFLRRYRAGAEEADLNLDGRTDEADLRLFLDVARPIRRE